MGKLQNYVLPNYIYNSNIAYIKEKKITILPPQKIKLLCVTF